MLRRRDIPLVIGIALLAVMVFFAAIAPLLYPDNPLFSNAMPMELPSWDYPLGTDHTGRDITAMMVWGTRVSLLFAFGAAGISLIFGTILGAISGYYGGIVDDVMSRTFEIFNIVPRLFLIILIVAVFGSNIWLTVAVIGLTLWPSNARIMRAQVLTLKQRGYAHAAIVSGAGPLTVLFSHIVPNGIGPVLANSTLQMAYAVLTEAGLAFLGLSDPNVASWGQVLYWGQGFIASAPRMVIVPGLAIALLLMSFHLIGNTLQERIDPRQQGAMS